MFVKAFGLAVRRSRERLRLSQERLGFRSELDRTYISGIERGVRNPTLRTILRIASALETRPGTLLRRAEELADRRAL